MAKKKRTGSKPPPICKAILLCKSIMVDTLTGEISIIGIQTKWHFSHFPGSTPPFSAYLQLTNGLGNYLISVQIHDLLADQIILEAPVAEAEFPERFDKLNLFIPFEPLRLDHAGRYDLVVHADDQEVDRQQFEAIEDAEGASHESHGFFPSGPD